MKKMVGYGAAVVILAVCALSYRNHRDNALLPLAERQSLRDAIASPANGAADDSSAASSDLNSAGEAAGQIVQSAHRQARAAASGGARVYLAGYVAQSQTESPIQWIAIQGGIFTMGTNDRTDGAAGPTHQVTVVPFEMTRSLITIGQYAKCVDAGQCTKPRPVPSEVLCHWGSPGYENTPVTCVTWEQANQFAKFMGARLPTEAEWEYAATSEGRNQKYPWGNEPPTCDRVTTKACAVDDAEQVCSKPAGNTAQGLCDMVGVGQWVQDVWHADYIGAPADGGAWEAAGTGTRVVRGGNDGSLRADHRNYLDPGLATDVGFRLARSVGVRM